jgi:hypothetical protein
MMSSTTPTVIIFPPISHSRSEQRQRRHPLATAVSLFLKVRRRFCTADVEHDDKFRSTVSRKIFEVPLHTDISTIGERLRTRVTTSAPTPGVDTKDAHRNKLRSVNTYIACRNILLSDSIIIYVVIWLYIGIYIYKSWPLPVVIFSNHFIQLVHASSM